MPYVKCKSCEAKPVKSGFCSDHVPRCHCGAQEYRARTGLCIKHIEGVPARYYRPNCKCGKRLRVNQDQCVTCRGPAPYAYVAKSKCKCGKRLMADRKECATCTKSHVHVFISRRKSECVHGHDYTPENIVQTKRGRRCRKCMREQARDYEARNPQRRSQVNREMKVNREMRRRSGPAEVTVKARRTTQLDPSRMKLNHRAWRALKSKFKSHSKIQGSPCWLAEHGMCLLDGVPIDYTSKGMPDSYETDHKIPRSVRPDLWLVWANLRPSHLRCNRSRQAKDVGPQHVWVRPTF